MELINRNFNNLIMKRTFIFACFCILGAHSVWAQTSKGSMMLGGSIGFTDQTNAYKSGPDYNWNSFNVSPEFGYFVADNILVGLNVDINTTTVSQGMIESESFGFSIGPKFRWYKPTSNEKFSFFAQAAVSFGKVNEKDTNGIIETESSTTRFGASLSPGFAYFFNEHWSAELALTGIGFSRQGGDDNTNNDGTTYFTFGVSSFTPLVGVRYYF